MFVTLRPLCLIALLCCCLSLSTSRAVAHPQAAGKSTEVNQADHEFTTLLDKHWHSMLQHYPEYASFLGMGNNELNSHWTDNSLAAIKLRDDEDKQTLATLNNIDRQALSASNQINYDLFKWQIQMRVNEQQFERHLIPLSQRSGIQTINNSANYVSLDTETDYKNWLSRLDKLPELITQTRKLMEMGLEKGILPPKATMQRVPAQLDKLLIKEPSENLFYAPFKQLPAHFNEAQQAALRQQAKTIIKNQLVPAYTQFQTFFVEQYLPACRDSHGVSALPNGKALYQYLVEYFTTTEMTPEEIHQLGLAEVARNRKEMQAIIKEVEFDGDFAAFLQFLRTDPQFYYDTPEALFEAYLAISKRLDPELTRLFGKLPRMPYGLKPIPDNVAADTTTAYYSRPSADGLRAGYYFVNLHQPETRPKYEMEVLSVHEAVPGHHLQIALQMELEGLPNFRRYTGFTVFTEGWGLYSERLGYDMGLYQDPYSRFGQLTYDMWRSVRLVVDTGIHYMGWTRQQAIDYFKANAAKSEADIINEIDRYISNPGQALAYKIGQLKILELRQRAEDKLGDQFDIRGFHDVVLGQGSIPLHVLETNVNQWIATQQ